METNLLKKNKFLLSQDINLIRVREHPLKLLSENDLIVKAPLEKVNLDEILKKIYPFVDNKIKEQINTYQEKLFHVLVIYMNQAVQSDRTNVINLLEKEGHHSLAESIRRM